MNEHTTTSRDLKAGSTSMVSRPSKYPTAKRFLSLTSSAKPEWLARGEDRRTSESVIFWCIILPFPA